MRMKSEIIESLKPGNLLYFESMIFPQERELTTVKINLVKFPVT
jgi:hypothetical protein